ncbi:MAG: hypothetical protein U1E27_01260, partial [Kiritimatiellia bacterium]|nr:hypothetical protein [Kiritimatiellia bacterium]
MNRKDLPWIILLGALLLLWPWVDKNFILPRMRPQTPPGAVPAERAVPAETAQPESPVDSAIPLPVPTEAQLAQTPQLTAPPADVEPPDAEPEQFVVVTNEYAEMTFTTRGAG